MVRNFLKRTVNRVDFFFCFLNNLLYIKRYLVWSKMDLPGILFFSNLRLLPSKLDFFCFKLLNEDVKFWLIFWKLTRWSLNFEFLFFSELELIGLGYRIKKITPTLYRFFWGYANFIYLLVPASVVVEYLIDSRRLFILGVDQMAVNSLTTFLFLLKKSSVYRIAGFVKPNAIVRLKAGKQR